MTLLEISDTSIVISLFRNSVKWSRSSEQRLIDIYHNSQISRVTKAFWAKIEIYFKHSTLGRMIKTKQKTSGILENSLVVQFLFKLYKKWKLYIVQFSKASSMYHRVENTKMFVKLSPVRTISMIVIIAIITNMALSFILQKHIGLWGWLMRGLFLSAAIMGLSHKADWQSVKRSSAFLRRMRMY